MTTMNAEALAEEAGESGPALEAAEAALAELHPNPPVRFRFRWREIAIEAEVYQSGSTVVLKQCLELGPVPYNAEDPMARRRLHGLVRQAIPVGWFSIGPKQRLILSLEQPLEPPVTGSAIVIGVTRALLGAVPYLSLARP